MNVTWILEPDTFYAYHQKLVAEIHSQGHAVCTLPAFYTSIECGDTNRYYDEFSPEGTCVICHASFQFTDLVADDEVWSPGTYGNSTATDCSNYFPHLDGYLLNDDYELLPFKDLATRADSLVRSFGIDDRIFIRPDSGRKAFSGRLFSRTEIQSQTLRPTGMSPNALVVVSRPKRILREWRFIVVDGRVIAGSMYKENESIHVSSNVKTAAWDSASVVASRYLHPDRVWVLDTCETPGGGMFVVEINGFSSSNWYSCALEPIVTSVSRVAIDDWRHATRADQVR